MSRSRLRLVVAIASALIMVAACADDDEEPAASDETIDVAEWTPEFVDGVLQPLPDGFPSEPITILNAAEPDNDDGIYARHLQEALDGISPVDIRVLDRPDFGTYGAWEALAWQAEQPGGNDGYIMQVVAVPGSTFDLLATPVAADLGSSIDTMNVVALTESAPYVVISRKGAPWGNSFEEMLEWGRQNPGELRYISRGPGAGPDMAFTNYITEAGVEVNTSIGGSHAEQNTAIGAGEADVAVTIAGQVAPFLDRIEVLACTGETNPCVGPWGEAPSAASVLGLERDIWGSNRGLAVTQETPELHRAWLAALIDAVVQDDGFLKARSQIPGLVQNLRDHAEARELMEFGLVVGRELLEPLGLIHPSVQ